jgi:predicted nucleic acid-binding protein
VWSLAFRRDVQPGLPEVGALRAALLGAEQVFTTGLVLQEVLQGFAGPNHRDQLVERLSGLAFLQPDKQDHIAAAEIRNTCRRRGVQIGTIDALLIQLSQRYDLTLLTSHDGEVLIRRESTAVKPLSQDQIERRSTGVTSERICP